MSFQAHAQNYLSVIDKELSKYPAFNNFEKQTLIPKVYAFAGFIWLYFFLTFVNFGGQLLTNLAGFVIPGYYSLETLFSASNTNNTQWLTYWVLFAFLTVLESAICAIYWFPFYYGFKFCFILWLVLPQTRGAEIIFRSFMEPAFALYFNGRGSTAPNLRAKADSATSDKTL